MICPSSTLVTFFYSTNYFHVNHIIKYEVMKHLEVPFTVAVLQVSTCIQTHNIHSLRGCYGTLFLGLFSWYRPDLKMMFTLKEAKQQWKPDQQKKAVYDFVCLCSWRITTCKQKKEVPVAVLWFCYKIFNENDFWLSSMRSNIATTTLNKKEWFKTFPNCMEGTSTYPLGFGSLLMIVRSLYACICGSKNIWLMVDQPEELREMCWVLTTGLESTTKS